MLMFWYKYSFANLKTVTSITDLFDGENTTRIFVFTDAVTFHCIISFCDDVWYQHWDRCYVAAVTATNAAEVSVKRYENIVGNYVCTERIFWRLKETFDISETVKACWTSSVR